MTKLISTTGGKTVLSLSALLVLAGTFVTVGFFSPKQYVALGDSKGVSPASYSGARFRDYRSNIPSCDGGYCRNYPSGVEMARMRDYQ